MKYIAYYRVSTRKQGDSGLGLMAQRESVLRYISPELIDKEFTEIETGTNKKERPVLEEAIELCKQTDATLLIAKIDRLSRNVAFISSLMNSGIKFTAVDMPHANELTIHIISAIAEHEAKLISQRTKEGIQQARIKAENEGKEFKIGSPGNLNDDARRKAVESIKRKRLNNENIIRAKAFLKKIDASSTLAEQCQELNENGFRTSKGKLFTPTQVYRLRKEIV